MLNRSVRTPHLPNGALPTAGAFTNQGTYNLGADFKFATFYVTYARSAGVAACQPKFRVLVGNGTEEGQILAIDPAITAVAPLGRQSAYLGEILGPIPSTDVAITFAIQLELRGGESTIRLLAAEHGASGTPGTMAIAVTSGK